MKPRIIYISSSSNLSGVPVHIKHLAQGLKDEFEIIVIAERGWLTEFLEDKVSKIIVLKPKLVNYFKFRNILREYSNENTIIHTQGVKAGFVGRLAAKNLPAKLIYTEHNWTKDYRLDQRWREPIQKFILKMLNKNTDKIVCVSEAVRDFYIKNNLSCTSKLEKIYNAVEFPPGKKVEDGVITIGTLGSLDPRKQFDTLIKAFSRVIQSHKNIRLQIMGGGSEYQNIKSLISELDLDSLVKIRDFDENTDKFWGSTDIYVQSSRDEAFGIAVAEAIGSGIPTIASNVGALPELLDQKYLFASQEELEQKLSNIIENYEDIKEEFEKNKDQFQDKFSLDTFSNKYKTFYKDILKDTN